eukprot:GHVP01048257.1.p1 GENE.GHVP01048257.1~~GHVP01048257.1.p1  ORF type:complete len:649 (-),score=100.87 GHVP01048257.1:109-2055(-)
MILANFFKSWLSGCIHWTHCIIILFGTLNMPPKNSKQTDTSDGTRHRIAIVEQDRCKPKKCKQDCKRGCPVNRAGRDCIEVTALSKISLINESMCVGCGICVKKCPFEAITIINLPKSLPGDTTHRFGPNTFKLHRLPSPRMGQILGLLGSNGIGKSTVLAILTGKTKPNLGMYDNPPEWSQILKFYRGSELQSFFTKLLEKKLKPVAKPQAVETIAKMESMASKLLKDIIATADKKGNSKEMMTKLDLDHLLDRKLKDLSGGELQRMCIALVGVQKGNVLTFDEPSSFLDVKQRIGAARTIREMLETENYIITVEHDLSILDYLSDFICCLWGQPSAYGVVTTPYGVREGINVFLEGFIPTENMRFREYSLSFKISQDLEEEIHRTAFYSYPNLHKTLGTFNLEVCAGAFADSQINVLLGQNGTGKTTFIRILAGALAPNSEGDEDPPALPKLSISYKPQSISPTYEGTVRQLFYNKIGNALNHPMFDTDVVKPLKIDPLMDQEVTKLSGGELQRVALILALGKPADLYLIDEPSAHLDSEQRVIAARVIKRYIMHAKKTAFIVEHDFIMATYLADQVIVYEGSPGEKCKACAPESLIGGMNRFLKSLDITFRRDPTNFRPRINKYDSVKDREQKENGCFFVEDATE